jgi:hypothetical protein
MVNVFKGNTLFIIESDIFRNVFFGHQVCILTDKLMKKIALALLFAVVAMTSSCGNKTEENSGTTTDSSTSTEIVVSEEVLVDSLINGLEESAEDLKEDVNELDSLVDGL